MADDGRATATGAGGEATSPPGGGPPPPDDPDVVVELELAGLEAWGRRLGRAATEPGEGHGVFVALHGPLGAGKTTLVRAACRGAGVEGRVRSPTFTLHNHHRPPGRRPLHHVDLYRIEGPEQLDELGWDELLGAEGPVFVEWAERAGDRLPRDRWEVWLGMADLPRRRRVAATRRGAAPPMPPPGASVQRDAPDAGGSGRPGGSRDPDEEGNPSC